MSDTSLCPACGAANNCSLADPRRATQPCWCYDVTIDPAVLRALPAHLRDRSCLCPRCAQVLDSLPDTREPNTQAQTP